MRIVCQKKESNTNRFTAADCWDSSAVRFQFDLPALIYDPIVITYATIAAVGQTFYFRLQVRKSYQVKCRTRKTMVFGFNISSIFEGNRTKKCMPMKSLTGRLEAIPLSLALEYVCVFLALIQLWWLKIKPQNWHRLQNYTHNKCDNLWHWQFVVRRRRRRWRWDRNRFPPSPPPPVIQYLKLLCQKK